MRTLYPTGWLRLFILGVILVFLAGCASMIPKLQLPPQEINLNIRAVDAVKVEEEVEKDHIAKSMVIPNEEGALSNLSFLCKNMAYIKIWGGLTVYDAQNLWNDIVILTEKHGVTEIHLFINSPGGDAFAGLALADEIQRAHNRGCKLIAHASGIVASAAVPVFAMCSERIASQDTVFMVHEAALWKYLAQEKVKDLKAQVKMMEILQKKYIGKLVQRSNLSFEEWAEKESKISYFTAQEAKEWGLVDKIE